jgi:hypothetical protein
VDQIEQLRPALSIQQVIDILLIDDRGVLHVTEI